VAAASGGVTNKGKGVWALLAEGLLRSLRLQRGVSMGVVFLNVTVEKSEQVVTKKKSPEHVAYFVRSQQ